MSVCLPKKGDFSKGDRHIQEKNNVWVCVGNRRKGRKAEVGCLGLKKTFQHFICHMV